MGLTRYVRDRVGGMLAPAIDEGLYFQLFRDRLAAHGLPCPYRPFGAGANASLLFVLTRCIELHRPARVLELGAGQSTLLLDALSDIVPMEIVSIEGDPDWRRAIGGRVRHTVHLAPVEERRHGRHPYRAYRLPDEARTGGFDLMLVDGPGGAKRFGRFGAMDVIPDGLNKGAVVLIDDAGRRGEKDTIAEARRRMEQAGGGPVRSLSFAGKGSQALLAPAETPWLAEI